MNDDIQAILDPLVLKPGDIIALSFDEMRLTQEEIDHLAAYVKAQGVTPILLPRSVEVIRLERE